jgi:hypothetical protein
MARMPDEDDEFQYWSKRKRAKYHAAYHALYGDKEVADEQLDRNSTHTETDQETQLS